MEKQIVVHQNVKYSVRDFLTMLFKYKRSIAAIFFALAAAVTVWVIQLPTLYEARSSLLLKIGREYVNRSDLTSDSPMMSLPPGELTNSEIQILTNRSSIIRVVKTLKLERIYPHLTDSPPGADPWEAAASLFEESLTVEAIKDSNVIQVSFQHEDPKVAAEAVNLLVDYFREKHLQVFSGPESSFVEMQLATYQKKLKEAEDDLQDFKQSNKVFSVAEQKSLLLTQRADLDSSLKGTESFMRELQQKIPALRHRLTAIGASRTPYLTPDGEKLIDEAKAKLLSMQLEEQQLLKKYTEANPLVLHFRREMQIVRSFLKEQEALASRRTNLGNTMYQTVEMELIKAETDLKSQRGRAAALREQLQRLNQEIETLDRSEKTVQELTLQRDVNQKNYETYLGKVEEARISEIMDRAKLANISVLQQATPPSEPVEPGKSQYFVRGILFSLVASLGFAFFKEYVGRGLSTPEAAERRLGVRVLAVISHQEG